MASVFISESARVTKSLRGATAYEAKNRVKVEDDDHESNISKGEKFYLKKLGKKHYVIDLEKEGGKTVYYQFIVDEATYNKLAKKHTNTDDAPAMKNKREQAANRAKAQNKKQDNSRKDMKHRPLGTITREIKEAKHKQSKAGRNAPKHDKLIKRLEDELAAAKKKAPLKSRKQYEKAKDGKGNIVTLDEPRAISKIQSELDDAERLLKKRKTANWRGKVAELKAELAATKKHNRKNKK